jgi:hypothetical protein
MIAQTKGVSLQGEIKERWLQLCEQAVTEQDPDKLFQLIHEINQLLEEKQAKLKLLQMEDKPAPRTLRTAI